ncbi:MAG TPA: hypothetical protein VIR38_12115, partial [Thalassobaculum sp.]
MAMPTDRRSFCLAAAALAAVAAGPRPVHSAPHDPEHADLAAAVKAKYLHKFAPFVEWPAD